MLDLIPGVDVEVPGEHEHRRRDGLPDAVAVDPRGVGENDVSLLQRIERESVDSGLDRLNPGEVGIEPVLVPSQGHDDVDAGDVVPDDLNRRFRTTRGDRIPKSFRREDPLHGIVDADPFDLHIPPLTVRSPMIFGSGYAEWEPRSTVCSEPCLSQRCLSTRG